MTGLFKILRDLKTIRRIKKLERRLAELPAKRARMKRAAIRWRDEYEALIKTHKARTQV